MRSSETEAVHALAFQPPVGARVAVHAPVFHPPVGTRVALLALVFLPVMRAPLLSHHYAQPCALTSALRGPRREKKESS